MKTQAELKAIARFVAEYATRLMGSGVHTSRVVRNTKRLGEALGVRVIVSAFQRVVNFSVFDDESGEVYSEVVDIPPLPISFELNADDIGTSVRYATVQITKANESAATPPAPQSQPTQPAQPTQEAKDDPWPNVVQDHFAEPQEPSF